MPTAARLFAAIAFAVMGFIAALIGKPLLPEGTQSTWFSPCAAFFGAVVGWSVMGGLVGRGYRAALESGLRTGVTQIFWTILSISIYQMVIKSLDRAYRGITEAVLGIFDNAFNYLTLMLDVTLIAWLIIGSILAGWLAEWASKRWR